MNKFIHNKNSFKNQKEVMGKYSKLNGICQSISLYNAYPEIFGNNIKNIRHFIKTEFEKNTHTLYSKFIAKFKEKLGNNFKYQIFEYNTPNIQKEIKINKLLNQGYPVCLSYQAQDNVNEGHVIVLVGYNRDNYIVIDNNGTISTLYDSAKNQLNRNKENDILYRENKTRINDSLYNKQAKWYKTNGKGDFILNGNTKVATHIEQDKYGFHHIPKKMLFGGLYVGMIYWCEGNVSNKIVYDNGEYDFSEEIITFSDLIERLNRIRLKYN